MKDKVFIGWSGSNTVANAVKKILEEKYNYICYIGGNSDNSSDNISIGDTVIKQIKLCNQAIMIFQNRADGQVSNNLFFELGFVFAKYGAKKVHCCKKEGETIVLPSDFDNSLVEPVKGESLQEYVDGVVKYFLSRQKMSIDANKMMLINNRYMTHDLIQSHYSENGSKCSDYELAQYILFYMQAAQMFGDEVKVQRELTNFKRDHQFEFSEELAIAVNLSLSFFEVLANIRKSSKGGFCIDAPVYKRYADSCEDYLDDIPADDTGTFTEWAKVFISQQLNYVLMLFAQNDENDEEMCEMLYEKCIASGHRTIELFKQLELTTPCKENNDSVGLISLFRAYVYRNLFVCYKYLNNPEHIKYLELTRKERKSLMRTFDKGTIDSKLFENFKMEYYLTLSEYLLCEEAVKEDRFEVKMLLEEIKNYLKETADNDDSNIYISQIGDYYEKLKTPNTKK